MRKISQLITKAECVLSALGERTPDAERLNRAVSALKDYRAKSGELPDERIFYLSFATIDPGLLDFLPLYDYRRSSDLHRTDLYICLIDYTTYIHKRIIELGWGCVYKIEKQIISLPPMLLTNKYSAADAYFDIQAYPVTGNFSVFKELQNAGFVPKFENVDFLGHFRFTENKD